MIIQREYDDQEIWDALVCSEFAGCDSFLRGVMGNQLDTPNDIEFTYIDQEDEETELEKLVTFADIQTAFAKVVNNKETHCSGTPVENLENSDACFAYVVLQYVLYGEVVFG